MKIQNYNSKFKIFNFNFSFFIFPFSFFLCFVVNCYAQQAQELPQPQISALEPIQKADRVLILAPHPDDETIGCAGVIQEAVKVGADVHVVYLTNGEHNQFAFIVYEKRIPLFKGEFIHLGQTRRLEAIKAMNLLGLDQAKLIFLGYPDFGTFTIFKNFWQSPRPYRDLLTRISQVPYTQEFSYGSAYAGENILVDLKTQLLKYRPNKIFVSHPADVNVDHKSFYLFLQIALADLQNELPNVKIYPYLVHCLGWPLPRHHHPELPLLPPGQFLESQIHWLAKELTPEELDKKYKAILCYRSQTESSAFYLLSFCRKNELFGDYANIFLTASSTHKELSRLYGFSNMFSDSGREMAENIEGVVEGDKGQVSYSLLDDFLFLRISQPEGVNRKLNMQVYLFGYSYKRPFYEMPKISIITHRAKLKVFDKRKRISASGVEINLEPAGLILKIPLKILGEPDFILTSLKVYRRGIIPADTMSFRKLVINR